MGRFLTPEPVTATLTTAGARVRVVASERSDTVVLVEPVDSANKSDVRVAANTKVGFLAGELSVKTTKSGGKNGSVVVTIEMPAGSKLVLNTAWTDVHATGQLGDCALNVASGQIRLDRIAALQASLSAGGVEIGHIAGPADIEGGTAAVRIGAVEGVFKYAGSTGQVWIGHAMSEVEFGGSNGSFDIDRAEGGVIAAAADCPIRIGRIERGQAELTNASEGIEVGIGVGTAASVDAGSTKGVVRNSLPVRDNMGELDDKVTLYARTRLDDIVLHYATV
ncbi:hypothetical protein [Amycolatopsis magusensis]|uniref:hypothetical protein n=1 Tax=Amycolatopsis magusensis TaxID=882444 RepID=UPI00378E9FF9